VRLRLRRNSFGYWVWTLEVESDEGWKMVETGMKRWLGSARSIGRRRLLDLWVSRHGRAAPEMIEEWRWERH